MLTSPAITELTTEHGPFAILSEWLRLWFDGNLHAVGNNAPVRFPKVNVAFGQSPAAQPLHDMDQGVDAEIRCVLFPRSELTEDADTALYSGKLVTDFVLFNFWISAKHPGEGQSEYAAEAIGQLLKAIMANRPRGIRWRRRASSTCNRSRSSGCGARITRSGCWRWWGSCNTRFNLATWW
jgi:hypothetical protein